MRVAVTGATGHLGVNLLRLLLERGHAVRAVVHRSDDGLDGLEVERVPGEVLAPETLRPAFAGRDWVFHLAGKISITGDPDGSVMRTNVDGARHAAEAALAAGVTRFVHTSSIHAFSQEPLDQPLDETRARATAAHLPAYDRSKAAGEAAVREVAARGLDAVIVHPTAVLGPLDLRPSRVGRVLLDLYHRRLPSLVDGGFDWVDVRDVARGLLAAAERGRTNESYLLAGHYHTVEELAALARQVTGVAPPTFVSPMWLARLGAPFIEAWGQLRDREPLYTAESLLALRANRQISAAKAARELDHRPRPLAETIADAYASFAAAGMLRPPLGQA